MGCWGFKRDKGSFFVFFFALVTAMYLSVLVFDTSLNMMIEKKSNIRTHLNDTSFHRYENETDVVRLTPWCTTTRDAYARMLFFYDKKLVDYDKGKSNYEYLPETYCFFGRTNDTFSKDVYSDEHFQKLYKKHAQEDSEYNIEKKDDDDTSFIKNRCFIRLIAHMSFERYDTMFDTILEDRRFESGGYCEYVWRIAIFDDKDVYDFLNVSMQHKDVVFALNMEKFKSSPIVHEFNEGLLNRISGLFTDACDMLTFFIVLDEYLQKRERRKKSARRHQSGEFEKCPQCSWRYVRLWLFWVLLAFELCYLMFYAGMSVDYVVYEHRCSQLNRFDFDNKNITFNSFYVNTYDNRNVATFYNANNASFFYDIAAYEYFKYTTTFHKFTMDSERYDDGYANDNKEPSCSSIWNDRFLMGMTKQHRITLSVFILMMDLVLVLFSTDFPSFDGHEKMSKMQSLARRQKQKITMIANDSRTRSIEKDDDDDDDDHFLFFESATDRYLSNRNLFSTLYYIIFKKWMCYKCLKNTDRDYFINIEDIYQKQYASEKQHVYFIPGFQSTQLENIFDCCKKKDVVGPNHTYEEDEDTEYEEDLFEASISEDHMENQRCERCILKFKKWTCKTCFGCFCFCCYDSFKYSRKSCYTNVISFKTAYPYIVKKTHPMYELKINSRHRKKKEYKNEYKNKPIITARWIMFITLFVATFFNITSLIQQCSFQPNDFNQIETTDGSIHLLKPNIQPDMLKENVNLCMVCPKKITIDNDPYDQRSVYDAFFKKSWRTIYETVEWTTLSSVRAFGDVKRSFVSNMNEKSRKLSKKMCNDMYGEAFWDAHEAHCSVWPVKQDSETVFTIDSKTFEKLTVFSNVATKQCRLKKKIKFKCDVYGHYEREKPLNTPFPYYPIVYSNHTDASQIFTVSLEYNQTTDTRYRIEPPSFQKDCNVYSYTNTPNYWDDSKYDARSVYDSEYEKTGDWFFYHDKNEKDQDSYCLSMSVLEWSEFNCENADNKEYLEDRYKNTDEDVEHVYDVYELKHLNESIVLDFNEKCWIALHAEKIAKPSYISNVSHDRKDTTLWGFEYEGTDYNYGHKKIWIGDTKKITTTTTRQRSTLFLPSKTTIGCKMTTCPTRTRNDQTDMVSSEYLNIVLHTVWLPICVVVYMIWSFTFNVYAVKMLKNYKDAMFMDATKNETERVANKKKFKRLKCMVSCCLICHCK
jgi:hypothetical protein